MRLPLIDSCDISGHRCRACEPRSRTCDFFIRLEDVPAANVYATRFVVHIQALGDINRLFDLELRRAARLGVERWVLITATHAFHVRPRV